jgi:phosphoglycolate phosphatase
MAAPTVVFDLDGTLVDTAPDLVGTLNVIFAREGLPPVAYDAARTMVGGGARRMIERGLAEDGRKLAAAEIDQLVRDFIDHYAAHIADHSRPFPGLTTALDELATRGCRLAVCTNKLEWLSVRLLDALGLSARFVAICGADTFGIQKPNPELLRRTIARAGGRIDAAIMVGDSISDIATAQAAGTPVIAVNYGYTERPVGELGPDRVIGALSDLPDTVFELLDGRQKERR